MVVPRMLYYSMQHFKFIPRYRLENSVKNMSGDRYSKKFSAWQHIAPLSAGGVHKIEIPLTEIPIRIRDALMMNYDLMEVLRRDRKTILKPPDGNRPRQMELFGDFLC